MRAGAIILLNGASSSGKSTLARYLQAVLNEPFLHLSSDQLVDGGAIPNRRNESELFAWPGSMRTRFFDGFHRCIPAMAAAGNNLVVEHIIEFPDWRDELRCLLDGFDVFLVGVHCDLGELDRREAARGDRALGEGRTHVEVDGIHGFGAYDLEVDTTSGVSFSMAEHVAIAWLGRAPRGALFR
ncbi:MAG: AAA family ATPase [Propionibacteriaceae bacterium]|nr:AAA family ATPase [Micropruina sp.]